MASPPFITSFSRRKMKDLVSAPHLITTGSWSETLVPCAPTQGIWPHLYDKCIPHANAVGPNYRYSSEDARRRRGTDSLLQPDRDSYSYSCEACPPSSCFLDSGLHASLATATVTALAAACLSCTGHVSGTHRQSLTSPSPLERWLPAYDTDGLGILGKSGSRVTAACGGRMDDVQDSGDGPVDSIPVNDGEWIYACRLFDAHRWSVGRGSSEVGLGLGPRMGDWARTSHGAGYDNGSTTVVIVIPDCTMADSTSLKSGVVSDSNSFNSSGPPGRSSVSAAEESHEAHGLGLIVKALVQQSASASLFLRTMVCFAALLCFAHSIFVLGERSQGTAECVLNFSRPRPVEKMMNV